MNCATSQTILPFSFRPAWQERIGSDLTSSEFKATRIGYGVAVHEPGKLVSSRNTNIQYADGVFLSRECVDGENPVLAFTSRRLYFGEASLEPLRESETALFGGNPPPRLSPSEKIKEVLYWTEVLSERINELSASPITPTSILSDLHAETVLEAGNGCLSDQLATPWNAVSEFGFHTVPKNFTVNVGLENLGDPRARLYAECLLDAFDRYHCPVDVNVMSLGDMVEHGRHAGEVGLVALEGLKPTALRRNEREAMNELDRNAVPYRAFSLSNTQMKWSARDQAASLVYTAGGIPYRLHLPWPEGMEETFLIGVDLGHPYGTRESSLVVTLSDSHGIHLCSWRFAQKRDETADLNALETGLGFASKMAEEISGSSNGRFLVIRDGRRNQAERVFHYRRALGEQVTFVDLSKRVAGHAFERHGDRYLPIPGGTAIRYGENGPPILFPIDPATGEQMIRGQKILMRDNWDRLNLGLDTVAKLIAGLCYAPSLGMKPHASPGPVYWANGVASIKPENCQFRGQNYNQSKHLSNIKKKCFQIGNTISKQSI